MNHSKTVCINQLVANMQEYNRVQYSKNTSHTIELLYVCVLVILNGPEWLGRSLLSESQWRNRKGSLLHSLHGRPDGLYWIDRQMFEALSEGTSLHPQEWGCGCTHCQLAMPWALASQRYWTTTTTPPGPPQDVSWTAGTFGGALTISTKNKGHCRSVHNSPGLIDH